MAAKPSESHSQRSTGWATRQERKRAISLPQTGEASRDVQDDLHSFEFRHRSGLDAVQIRSHIPFAGDPDKVGRIATDASNLLLSFGTVFRLWHPTKITIARTSADGAVGLALALLWKARVSMPSRTNRTDKNRFRVRLTAFGSQRPKAVRPRGDIQGRERREIANGACQLDTHRKRNSIASAASSSPMSSSSAAAVVGSSWSSAR